MAYGLRLMTFALASQFHLYLLCYQEKALVGAFSMILKSSRTFVWSSTPRTRTGTAACTTPRTTSTARRQRRPLTFSRTTACMRVSSINQENICSDLAYVIWIVIYLNLNYRKIPTKKNIWRPQNIRNHETTVLSWAWSKITNTSPCGHIYKFWLFSILSI